MQDIRDAAHDAVLASFVGDSLALCAHQIYDAKEIREKFGQIKDLCAPGPNHPHEGRDAGEFTHCGDQTFVLLKSLAKAGRFDLDDFFRRWRLLFTGYDGYIDRASKEALSRINSGEGPQGSGSKSNNLAGPARIGPLVYLFRDDLGALIAACRAQTKMTHNNPLAIETAEFFARAAFLAMRGKAPIEAMLEAAAGPYLSLPAKDWLDQGLEFASVDSVAATLHFGQGGNVEGAFRSTTQLIARFSADIKNGLIECVMAGGESAARAMLSGLVLGAAPGQGGAPKEWLAGLKKRQEIEDLLANLP
ncbi:MAG: ADP-ribosylglycohydrolase family protein [Thermodesulfobacteriota bacterium]|nr:ADP-ribosylglycohydrolase family protein [Thermodesulfobacteriota bacterium]